MLTEKQRKILRYAQLNASASLKEIAKMSGYREHTVRRCLRILEESNLIRKSSFINLAPLGFVRYNMFFSLSAVSKNLKSKFINDFVKDQNVIFLSEVGGNFQYELTFAVRNTRELTQFLDGVYKRVGKRLFQKRIVITLEKVLFGTKHLYPRAKIAPLILTSKEKEIEIDELDHQILSILANGGNLSTHALARGTGQPVSTIAYRIKALEKKKILLGDYYVHDNSQMGSLRFKILVYLRKLETGFKNLFFEFCKNDMNIDLLMTCVGEHDYELVVQASSYAQVVELVGRIREKFGEYLNNLEVFPCFKVYKFSDYPFKELCE